MLPSSAVKKEARKRLNNNWLTAIISATVLIFLYFVLQLTCDLFIVIVGKFITAVFAIVAILLIMCPIILGVLKVFWGLSEKAIEHPTAILYYFSNFKNYSKTFKLFAKKQKKTLAFCEWMCYDIRAIEDCQGNHAL